MRPALVKKDDSGRFLIDKGPSQASNESDPSEHAALVPPRYHRQHGNTVADADVANKGDRDRHTIALFTLEEKFLSNRYHRTEQRPQNAPEPDQNKNFYSTIAHTTPQALHTSQIWNIQIPLGIPLSLNSPSFAFRLPYSSALSNFDSTSTLASAPDQFLASGGNSLNFVDHPFLEEPDCPTFSAPSNTFSTPMPPSAHDQLLVAEDTDTNFVAHEWLTVSASSTSTSTSTSNPPDTSIQSLVPDDQTINLVDLDSQEENSPSFPPE
ncbi:hypothetical protein BT69DRAFT_1306111, partial [Atractiella rhizophila]